MAGLAAAWMLGDSDSVVQLQMDQFMNVFLSWSNWTESRTRNSITPALNCYMLTYLALKMLHTCMYHSTM